MLTITTSILLSTDTPMTHYTFVKNEVKFSNIKYHSSSVYSLFLADCVIQVDWKCTKSTRNENDWRMYRVCKYNTSDCWTKVQGLNKAEHDSARQSSFHLFCHVV